MRQHFTLGSLCMLLAAVIGLLVGLGASPLVQAGEVVIRAPSASLGQEVARQIVIPAGTSMLFFPLHQITSQVRACPRVEQVSVRRDSPHRLLVTVTARQPLLVLDDGDGYTLVSRDGVCLQRQASAPRELPIFRGLSAPRPPLGSSVDPQLLQHAKEVLEGATKGGIREGLRADFTTRSGIVLHTAGGTRAQLGNVNHLARKTAILGRLIHDLGKSGERPRQVDLSTPESPIWTSG